MIDSLNQRNLISEFAALRIQLKEKTDSNQVQLDQLKQELARSKGEQTVIDRNRNLKDSTLHHFLIAETDALLTQFKTRSDTDHLQVERLVLELKDSKVSGANAENDRLIALLTARSDSNQAQIDKLRGEFDQARAAETMRADKKKKSDSLIINNAEGAEVKLALLKARSESTQAQIDQIKVDNARTKIAGTLSAPSTDNTLAIGQLKARSDSSQAEIQRLKVELAKVKNADLKPQSNPEQDELISQLKLRSDSSLAQIDRLKMELAQLKRSEPKPQSNAEHDAVMSDLKLRSDSSQVQIARLKTDLAKMKSIEVKPQPNQEYQAMMLMLKTNSDNSQAEIDQLKVELAKTKEEVSKACAILKPTKTVADDNSIALATAKNSQEAAKGAPENDKVQYNSVTQPEAISSALWGAGPKTYGFIDEKGNPAGLGFYIVIGTFGNKENADKFKAANIIKGHRNTKIIQNKATNMYNIFALKTNNKYDADIELAKYKGEFSNVWILQLE